jgi:hypothetical protein
MAAEARNRRQNGVRLPYVSVMQGRSSEQYNIDNYLAIPLIIYIYIYLSSGMALINKEMFSYYSRTK